jgi:hypothetical protein
MNLFCNMYVQCIKVGCAEKSVGWGRKGRTGTANDHWFPLVHPKVWPQFSVPHIMCHFSAVESHTSTLKWRQQFYQTLVHSIDKMVSYPRILSLLFNSMTTSNLSPILMRFANTRTVHGHDWTVQNFSHNLEHMPCPNPCIWILLCNS